MLHKLFSSKVRIELLSTFFLHPEKSFYLRELERITGEDYKNISTEIPPPDFWNGNKGSGRRPQILDLTELINVCEGSDII